MILTIPVHESWLIGKESDAWRDWGQEDKGTTEDEMAGWHHWLDGRESEWTPGVGDGQGGLLCCDSWGRKESDTTERLNWTELNPHYDGIWRWGLWDVLRSWWVEPEVGLCKKRRGNKLSIYMRECGKKLAVCHMRLLTRIRPWWHCDLGLPAPTTVRNKFLLLISCPVMVFCYCSLSGLR